MSDNLNMQSKRRASTVKMVQLALLSAIMVVLAVTPLGMINLGFINATTLHIPVIVGAILLGPKAGAFLGGVFGLISLITNTIRPNLSSFAFSPVLLRRRKQREFLESGNLFCAQNFGRCYSRLFVYLDFEDRQKQNCGLYGEQFGGLSGQYGAGYGRHLYLFRRTMAGGQKYCF